MIVPLRLQLVGVTENAHPDGQCAGIGGPEQESEEQKAGEVERVSKR